MKIILNGEPREVAGQSTVQQLIEQLGLADRRLAMEINREIVPRSSYATHALQEGDTIEIVRAIGGG